MVRRRHSFTLCDFRGANLRARPFAESAFAGCDLRDADLRHTDLSYARFSYVMTHDPEYGRTDVTGPGGRERTSEAHRRARDWVAAQPLGIRGYVRLTFGPRPGTAFTRLTALAQQVTCTRPSHDKRSAGGRRLPRRPISMPARTGGPPDRADALDYRLDQQLAEDDG
ncbi:pentapeptide repeat-containing protein [Micromonospora sp. WMMD754]|uniref:pentapeptide repeat-containing protein n=1 Tax=Micromonospora sp. WMMD754 TaxID=3404114 RepID=UPI003BF558F7